MRLFRPAASHIGAALAAAALTLATCLPSEAATSPSWPIAFRGQTWAASQSGQITGITAFSPSNVWVFGASGAFAGLGTWHLSGGTWHKSTGLAKTISGASALSPTDMWAIGGQHEPNDTLVHYNGTGWHAVTSPALAGLRFGYILATSASNVFATAATGGGTPELVHFDGRKWQRLPVTLPKPVTELASIAPDGHGGLWFAGLSASAQPPRAVHRSASGTWSASKLSAGVGDVEDVALIPGTTSLWAAGGLQQTAGADAVIWGHGPGT